eukprot:1964933-Amphidinium_carterae.1
MAQYHVADDAPFVALVREIFGSDVDRGTLGLMRQLFFECYTACASDISARATRQTDAPPKGLPQAERDARLKLLRDKMPGLRIRSLLELADGLVDACCQMRTRTASNGSLGRI